MRAAVPRPETSDVYRMLFYHLGWTDPGGEPYPPADSRGYSGKKLRPALLLLAAEAAGGAVDVAVPAAASVELLHNFSLIHDDIQDRSPERRHRPVVWVLWGTEQAINAGDAMHAIAGRAILRCAEVGASAVDTIEVARLLHECCLRLVEGQYLDLQFERRDDVTPQDYYEMIAGKTGALIATSIEIGAILGGGRASRRHWREFGERLGRAFQLVDDVLGIWGDSRVTGKPAADDVYRAKRSLPFLLAASSLPPDAAARLRAIYAEPERDARTVAEAIALMDRARARPAAEADARAHFEAALEALDRTGAGGHAAEALRALARFVVERQR